MDPPGRCCGNVQAAEQTSTSTGSCMCKLLTVVRGQTEAPGTCDDLPSTNAVSHAPDNIGTARRGTVAAGVTCGSSSWESVAACTSATSRCSVLPRAHLLRGLRQPLPQLLRHKRHEGVQQPQPAVQRSTQRLLRGCLGCCCTCRQQRQASRQAQSL